MKSARLLEVQGKGMHMDHTKVVDHTLRHCGNCSYLRCNVVWGATEGGGQSTISDVLFAHTKVSHLHMTISIQKDIVQLQISVETKGS